MKKAILLSLSAIVLFAACERNDGSKRIYNFGAGYIKYEATIGNDFESALDSLIKVIPFNRLYDRPYYIDPEVMNRDRIDYPSNDREFYMIIVRDSITGLNLSSPSNVLDTKGDWYKIIWGED